MPDDCSDYYVAIVAPLRAEWTEQGMASLRCLVAVQQSGLEKLTKPLRLLRPPQLAASLIVWCQPRDDAFL